MTRKIICQNYLRIDLNGGIFVEQSTPAPKPEPETPAPEEPQIDDSWEVITGEVREWNSHPPEPNP